MSGSAARGSAGSVSVTVGSTDSGIGAVLRMAAGKTTVAGSAGGRVVGVAGAGSAGQGGAVRVSQGRGNE